MKHFALEDTYKSTKLTWDSEFPLTWPTAKKCSSWYGQDELNFPLETIKSLSVVAFSSWGKPCIAKHSTNSNKWTNVENHTWAIKLIIGGPPIFERQTAFILTLWEPGYDIFVLWFQPKTAVFGCLTNALAPLSIALESCSRAQPDRPA